MATVWSTPKQEYNGTISNMGPRWSRDTVSAENMDEALIILSKVVCAFYMILAEQLSNLGEEAEFQAKLYKNIDLDTAKAIIAATHRPNCEMHKITTLVNRLPKKCVGRRLTNLVILYIAQLGRWVAAIMALAVLGLIFSYISA